MRVPFAREGKEEPLTKGRRHKPERIIRKLREADRLLGEGKTIADVARSQVLACRRRAIGTKGVTGCIGSEAF